MCVRSEVASYTEAMEKKERGHKTEIDAMATGRAMLEVSQSLGGNRWWLYHVYVCCACLKRTHILFGCAYMSIVYHWLCAG